MLSFSEYSSLLFGSLLQNPALLIAPLAALVLVYSLNYRFLKTNIYLENLAASERQKPTTAEKLGFLKKYGEIGELISLEVKLILRNKRLKSQLYMSPLMLVIGLMFFANENYQKYDLLLVYMATFFTGMFMINYGQFIFSWESHYFDAIISNRIDPFQYLKSKFIILVFSCAAFWVLMLPFAWFGIDILYLNTALALFNMGFNAFLLLFKATYNRQKIDLNAGAMSMQGKDTKQFFIVMLLVIVPILIYIPFRAAEIRQMGYLAIGVIGATGLLFYHALLRRLLLQFNRQKYKIAAGFREN